MKILKLIDLPSILDRQIIYDYIKLNPVFEYHLEVDDFIGLKNQFPNKNKKDCIYFTWLDEIEKLNNEAKEYDYLILMVELDY